MHKFVGFKRSHLYNRTTNDKYKLTISRTTIDKLGVKLYDKVSDVVSELISNSYDADAEKITIDIPLNEYLATKHQGVTESKDYKIIVKDDGHGFTENEANDFFLKVGSDRRQDSRRRQYKDKSKEHGRSVMGRKGIGKLASFGICKKIEVWSAAGKKGAKKYKISHFIMNYDDIQKDTYEVYNPQSGHEDGTFSKTRGTKITLSNFLYKKIPDVETFKKQLARKFGISRDDFKIEVVDSMTKKSHIISTLDIVLMKNTKISVKNRPICLDDNNTLPVRGWVAYAKKAYEDEEMAGVRIYARGKLAVTTRDFGRKSGFTGEYHVRTHLVGEIYADWLDDDDDLIASDRQDILWSSEKGEAFKKWGQVLIKELGKKSDDSVKRKKFDEFKKISKLEERAKKKFGDTPIYKAALDLGKSLASNITEDGLKDSDYVKRWLELILSIAPHKIIVDNLKRIADAGNQNASNVISSILCDTMLAETASLGQIAHERIRAIKKLEITIRQPTSVVEAELHNILKNAPWLIDPQWTVFQSNRSFIEFEKRFKAFYKKKRRDVSNQSIDSELGMKRPDFIMLHIKNIIEIIEIKKPKYSFKEKDYERLHNYYKAMKQFVKEPGISQQNYRYHILLICDEIDLKDRDESSYDGLVKANVIAHKTWDELLSNTRHAHDDFLKYESSVFKKPD